jgi:ABC-2 type transport system permease protein
VSASLYASSLSSHAIVSYVLGFGMLLGLFLLGQAAATLPPAAQDWIVALSPIQHFANMLRGVIGLEDVVFLLAVSAGFIALTWFQLERRRWR